MHLVRLITKAVLLKILVSYLGVLDGLLTTRTAIIRQNLIVIHFIS